MNRRRTLLLTALLFLLGMIVFYHHGRSIWHPAKLKVFGRHTVAEVVATLEPEMRRRFPDLERLVNSQSLAILAFKEEQILELWAQSPGGWERVRDYKFSGFSGGPGPKLAEGDLQIPEGIYRVEYLNPNSLFYLSIKIDYPNDFDRAKAAAEHRTKLGGDIFIHGMEASTGCIPVGNDNIEELFYLVAKNGIENTTVIVVPYDLRAETKPLQIDTISWESELYALIAEQLRQFPRDQIVFDVP